MANIAVFVEGQTEQIFFQRLILEISGKKNLSISQYKFSGPAGNRVRSLVAQNHTTGSKHKVQLFDSSGEWSVASDISDQYQSLVESGVNVIIGVRDLFPSFSLVDLPKVRRLFGTKIAITSVVPEFVFGVMECEAWFLAEYRHFEKIHPKLTLEKVTQVLGVDPSSADLQSILRPAAEMNKIYQSVGKGYRKRKATVQKIVDVLDYAEIYLNFPAKFPDIENLVRILDKFLL